MKKAILIFSAIALMSLGWASAFLLSSSHALPQAYWLLPALVIGSGVGLGMRTVRGLRTALLLALSAAIGLALVNQFFPNKRISVSSVRELLADAHLQAQNRTLTVAAALRTPPFDQTLLFNSPVPLAISVFSRFPAGIDDFCFAADGSLYASLPRLGAVYTQAKELTAPEMFAHGLDNPSGLVCTSDGLLVAESSRVSSYSYLGKPGRVLLAGLPEDGGHLGHRLLNSPAGLLIATGSRCDACSEPNPQRGTIQLLEPEGGLRVFARGLRDVGGLAISESDGRLWASERSRVYPAPGAQDELNVIRSGADYGWPACDSELSQEASSLCAGSTNAELLLHKRANPAGLTHTAKLELPSIYRNSLLLVMQGDIANRILPAIVRIPITKDGTAMSPVAFLGGFDGLKTLPSAIHAGPDGALYVADGINGAIYRVTWWRGD